MRRVILSDLSSVLVICLGCGATSIPTPQAPSCLTFDDVINIPAGDATGTEASGVYRAVTVFLESCVQCSQNTITESECTDVTLDAIVRTTFTQDDGVLTAEFTDGTTARGGINADGTFTIGAIGTPTRGDGVQTGQGLVLVEGTFEGDIVIATLTVRLTGNEPDGDVIDLEAVAVVTFERDE